MKACRCIVYASYIILWSAVYWKRVLDHDGCH